VNTVRLQTTEAAAGKTGEADWKKNNSGERQQHDRPAYDQYNNTPVIVTFQH